MGLPDEMVVAMAVYGPTIAGLVWLLASRSIAGRRVLAGALALASHLAAWTVLSRVYAGQEVSWRGLSPGLLEASILVLAQIGVLLAGAGARPRTAGHRAGTAVALGACLTATALGTFADGLVTIAIALPLSTFGVLVAGLTGPKGSVAGLGGLAAADVLGLAGLSLAFASTGSVLVEEAGGAAGALLVAAGALKAGAVPGVGGWSLVEAPAGPPAIAAALRGQGIGLAALGGLSLSKAAGDGGAALVLGALAMLGGILASRARRPQVLAASLGGVGACLSLLGLGLGGAVGVRAFLLGFPAFLLSSAVLGSVRDDPAAAPPRWARWAGPLAMGVAVASVLGLPPGGGAPGAWLALRLAAARAVGDPSAAFVVFAAALGIAAAAYGSVGLARALRPRFSAALAGVAAAAFLLYMGIAPVRLAIGWWVRIERALEVPRVLGSVGAPELPPVPGEQLAIALALATLLTLGLLAAGRGIREVEAVAEPEAPAEPGRLRAMLGASREQAERMLLRPVFTGLLIAATVVLAGRLVLLGAHQGFL